MSKFISFLFYSILFTFLLSVVTEVHGYETVSVLSNAYCVFTFLFLGIMTLVGSWREQAQMHP